MNLISKMRGMELFELDEPINLTEQNGGIETIAKYEVKGLEEDVIVIFQKEAEKEYSYFLGYFIGDTGLLVNLADEEMYKKVIEFVMESLSEE